MYLFCAFYITITLIIINFLITTIANKAPIKKNELIIVNDNPSKFNIYSICIKLLQKSIKKGA